MPLDLNTAAMPGVLMVGNDPALSSTFSPLISLIVATAIKESIKKCGAVEVSRFFG